MLRTFSSLLLIPLNTILHPEYPLLPVSFQPPSPSRIISQFILSVPLLRSSHLHPRRLALLSSTSSSMLSPSSSFGLALLYILFDSIPFFLFRIHHNRETDHSEMETNPAFLHSRANSRSNTVVSVVPDDITPVSCPLNSADETEERSAAISTPMLTSGTQNMHIQVQVPDELLLGFVRGLDPDIRQLYFRNPISSEVKAKTASVCE